MSDSPRLETDRLILRPPGAQDFETWAAFKAGPRARMAGGVQDRAEAWRFFGHMVGHWSLRGFGWFVVTDRQSDASLGLVGAHFPEGWPEKELGWTIWSAADEGKGFAFEAAVAARDWVYRDLGWPTAVSYIDPANARSVALARRLGAVEDPHAARVHPEDLVFRHPAPEALQ
jgi:RimJ/RimL family protein N-acetyltransferase